MHRGFANSFGQKNWYQTYSFNFDWSFYLRTDKAVKTGYAGYTPDVPKTPVSIVSVKVLSDSGSKTKGKP